MRRAVVVVTLAGLVMLVVAGLAGCTSTLGYAAIVNGSVISQNTINQDLADIAKNTQYVKTEIDASGGPGPLAGSSAGTYNKSFVAVVLNAQVQGEVIRQLLAAHHALPSEQQVTTAKNEILQAISATTFGAFPVAYQNVLINQQADDDAFVRLEAGHLSKAALTAYYQSHQADYATEECVRVIVIADKNSAGQIDYPSSLSDAQKLEAQLNAGGDFASLANAADGSSANGGVVSGSAPDGCLASSDLQNYASQVPSLVQAMVTLPLNQVSSPIEAQNGVNILEVTSRNIEPLDSTVMTDIQERLAGQDLNTLMAKAKVTVNPEFGSFNRALNSNGVVTGVVPPVVPSAITTTTAVPAGT